MFAPADFVAPGALWDFLVGLQVPISPWLSALEILEQRFTGSTEATTAWLYRFCMVGAYVLAMALAWPSIGRLLAAFALSLLFLWATVLAHPPGATTDGAVFAFLLVAYFGLLRLGAAARDEGWAAAALVPGGFALALAELTRPDMILFLAPLLLGAWFTLRRARRFVALIAPVILLSGPWHLHQAVNHGQLAWSNHAGFNLAGAWPMVPHPELMAEPDNAPVAPARRPNLNTREHGENDRRMRRAVVDYVLAHPGESALHAIERVAAFVGAGHRRGGHAPDDAFLAVYDFLIKYADLAVLASAVAMLVALAMAPRRAGALLGDTGNQILAFAALSMGLVAVTAGGEEERFQLAVLPLLAAMPVPYLPRRERSPDYVRDRRRRRRGWAAALTATVLAVAVVEVLAWGARREPARAAGGGPIPPAAASAPIAGTGGATGLRVAQFNIRGGAWRDPAAEVSANAACLKDVDIAALAEVRGAGPFGRGENQAAMLARETGLTALFAPTERRWWSERFGNALLSARPILRWERASLPHQVGLSYRGLLAADVQIGDRTVRVLVTQIDIGDKNLQVAAVDAVFRNAPSPAVLLADMGPAEPLPDEPLRRLIGDPAFLVFTNQPPFPAAQAQGGYVIAKGFRRVASSFCKGGASPHPRLAVELAFEP
jgi:hypothetical protein